MAYFEDIKSRDLMTLVKRALQAGGGELRVDGKVKINQAMAWDSPWHHVRFHPMLDCGLWHGIMFDIIALNLPLADRFVPSKCQECYKVVVRPKTIKQLFALLNLQKRMDLPSKCGIEMRESVHGLYGGYFYNLGLDAGRGCYKKVRAEVNQDEHLGPEIGVVLKKACTEYEQICGPSDKWKITLRQLEIESMVESLITKDDYRQIQPEHTTYYVHRKWIEWAYAMGDPTYAEFTDGPLYEPYVTYHED